MYTLNFMPRDHEQLETFEKRFGEVPWWKAILRYLNR